jgi:outer membrane protein OmpA-like peptidoglycan-associated protein
MPSGSMRRWGIRVAVVWLGLASGPARANDDLAGSKDHPLFHRVPGYAIRTYDDQAFSTHEMRDTQLRPFVVDGRVTHIGYAVEAGAKAPGRGEILRSYENAIKVIGGTVLVSDWDGISFLSLTEGGRQVWVEVSAYVPGEVQLWVIERKAREDAATAETFKDDLARRGHVAVYDLWFDTNQAVIKPASQAALAEIAKLLAAEPALKLNVVGHTDGIGSVEANRKLSQARAAAVVNELVARYRVAAARLRAYGVGPLAPVASNDTEEGRAHNRRVELVKR